MSVSCLTARRVVAVVEEWPVEVKGIKPCSSCWFGCRASENSPLGTRARVPFPAHAAAGEGGAANNQPSEEPFLALAQTLINLQLDLGR